MPDGERAVGEAQVVQGGVEQVAGGVAGEDPAGAVGAVRGGGEADQDEGGVGRAEAGDRAGPVVPVQVGAAFDPGRLLAPLDQTGAGPAVGDDAVEDGEVRGPGGGCGGVQRVFRVLGGLGRGRLPGGGLRHGDDPRGCGGFVPVRTGQA